MDHNDKTSEHAKAMPNVANLRRFAGSPLPENGQLFCKNGEEILQYPCESHTTFTVQGHELDAFIKNGEWNPDRNSLAKCKEIVARETGLFVSGVNRLKRRATKAIYAKCFYSTLTRGECPVRVNIEVILQANGSTAEVKVKPYGGAHTHKTTCTPPSPSKKAILESMKESIYHKLREACDISATSVLANVLSMEHDGMEVTQTRLGSALRTMKAGALMKLLDVKGDDSLVNLARVNQRYELIGLNHGLLFVSLSLLIFFNIYKNTDLKHTPCNALEA